LPSSVLAGNPMQLSASVVNDLTNEKIVINSSSAVEVEFVNELGQVVEKTLNTDYTINALEIHFNHSCSNLYAHITVSYSSDDIFAQDSSKEVVVFVEQNRILTLLTTGSPLNYDIGNSGFDLSAVFSLTTALGSLIGKNSIEFTITMFTSSGEEITDFTQDESNGFFITYINLPYSRQLKIHIKDNLTRDSIIYTCSAVK